MRAIAERPAGDHSSLAEAALPHPPSITRIVRDLEARRLIIRVEDAADRRRTLISLSESGKALVQEISQDMAKVYGSYAAPGSVPNGLIARPRKYGRSPAP